MAIGQGWGHKDGALTTGERNRGRSTQKEPLIENHVMLPSDLRHLAPRKTSELSELQASGNY